MTKQEIVRTHIANIARPVAEQDLSIYSDSMVCDFPYAPEGHTNRLEGPARRAAPSPGTPSFATSLPTAF